MTWKELKEAAENAGVKDEDEVARIVIYGSQEHILFRRKKSSETLWERWARRSLRA